MTYNKLVKYVEAMAKAEEEWKRKNIDPKLCELFVNAFSINYTYYGEDNRPRANRSKR